MGSAMTVDEISESLQLYNIRRRTWHIQPTCGVNRNGLYEGFEWLSHAIY